MPYLFFLLCILKSIQLKGFADAIQRLTHRLLGLQYRKCVKGLHASTGPKAPDSQDLYRLIQV